MSETSFVRVLKETDLPRGSKRAVDIQGKSILICHSEEGWYAVSNICSHARQKLECGQMSRRWIACPIHGARFDLASGRALNPPAIRPIATYPLRIVDGWIELSVAVQNVAAGG